MKEQWKLDDVFMMPQSDEEDSIDFDITVSSSGFTYSDPLTPPPTIRTKTWKVQLQNKIATCAIFIFVTGIVLSIILLFINIKHF